MPLFRSGTTTWSSLTSSWAASTGPWYAPLGDASGNVSHTTAAVDIEETAWVWPQSSVIADGIGNAGITISYQSSTDNVSFTNQSVTSFEGRYFKTVIEADADVVYSVYSEFNQDIKTRTYQDLDTTTLTGSTAQRSIDLSQDFSAVFGLVVNSGASESEILIVDVANTAPANVAFTLRDVDTYGKVAVDGTVNITVTGYPAVALDSTEGVVERSDR